MIRIIVHKMVQRKETKVAKHNKLCPKRKNVRHKSGLAWKTVSIAKKQKQKKSHRKGFMYF